LGPRKKIASPKKKKGVPITKKEKDLKSQDRTKGGHKRRVRRPGKKREADFGKKKVGGLISGPGLHERRGS